MRGSRKFVLLCAGLLWAASASAQWQKKYPVVKYGVLPVETQTGTTRTMEHFLKHAEKTTGVKWELYQATDYSGVMNALIAGQINLAWLSGFSYCQTFADSKGGVEPLVAAAAVDGSMGYNAVVVVRADSPYKTIDDLKGKPVDEYYKSPLSGGHVQSVLGVLKGTYDAAFTWTSKGDGFGNIRQMMNQGLLKREDIRIIWTSEPLPSPPVVIRKDVPADMRADMLKLFTTLHKVDMALAESVAQGKTTGIMAVSHKDYGLMCQAAADEREARRKRAK